MFDITECIKAIRRNISQRVDGRTREASPEKKQRPPIHNNTRDFRSFSSSKKVDMALKQGCTAFPIDLDGTIEPNPLN